MKKKFKKLPFYKYTVAHKINRSLLSEEEMKTYFSNIPLSGSSQICRHIRI